MMPVRADQVTAAFSNKAFSKIVRKWRELLERNVDADLSQGFRRRLADAVLGGLERDLFAERVVAAGVEVEKRRARASAGTPPPPLSPGFTADTIKRSFWKEAEDQRSDWTPYLLHLIAETFDPERRMYETEFLSDPFRGPNAPFLFTRRLLGLPRIEQWTGADLGKRGFYHPEGGDRAALRDDVAAFIKRADCETQPCFVVHSRDVPRGLSALGADLLQSGRREQPGFASPPHCLISVSPHAPPHKGVDLPLVLLQIQAFYEGGTETPSREALSDGDVRKAVARVRRLMAEHPAVFIFDGVQDYGDDLPHLRSVMVDDPFHALITQLVMPDAGSAAAPASCALYGRNRFIILADGPCHSLSAYVGPGNRRHLPLPSVEFAASTLLEDRISGSERTEKVYANGVGLSVWFSRHAAEPSDIGVLPAASETALQLADGLLAMGVPAEDMPAPAGLADRFLAELASRRPAWELAMAFLVHTPGGLFEATLRRVLVAQQGPGAASKVDASALCETFRSMLAQMPDRTVLDLRTGDPHEIPRGDGTNRQSINFRSSATRMLLLEAYGRRLTPSVQASLHASLAEEALRQHTLLMRDAERDDFTSIRENRRLLQGLYHGVLSARADLPLRSASRPDAVPILPSDPARRLVHLYAMFYRLLLEAPPGWEVSRVMGAEGVKLDLLSMFLGVGGEEQSRSRLIAALPGLTLAADQLDLMQACGGGNLVDDLLYGLAQGALQLNEFALFDNVLALAETRVASDAARMDLLKLRIDGALLRHRLADALAMVRRELDAISWSSGSGATGRESASVPTDGAATAKANVYAEDRARCRMKHTWRRLIRLARRRLVWEVFPPNYPLADIVGEMDSTALNRAIHLFQRWGEILAASADERLGLRLDADRGGPIGDYPGLTPKQLTQDGPLLSGIPPRQGRGRRRLLEAYVLFALADEMRRRAFHDNPLGRNFVLSGHPARIHIRTLLLRHRLAADAGRPMPGHMALVRRRADSLTRNFARFPAERASMQILEGMIARMSAREGETPASALDFMIEADRQLVWSANRPRVHMRLLFERAKVWRGLAQSRWSKDRAAALHALAWARFDTDRLANMVLQVSDQENRRLCAGTREKGWLWVALARRCALKTAALERKLGRS